LTLQHRRMKKSMEQSLKILGDELGDLWSKRAFPKQQPPPIVIHLKDSDGHSVPVAWTMQSGVAVDGCSVISFPGSVPVKSLAVVAVRWGEMIERLSRAVVEEAESRKDACETIGNFVRSTDHGREGIRLWVQQGEQIADEKRKLCDD